jgi:hypothetical protein
MSVNSLVSIATVEQNGPILLKHGLIQYFKEHAVSRRREISDFFKQFCDSQDDTIKESLMSVESGLAEVLCAYLQDMCTENCKQFVGLLTNDTQIAENPLNVATGMLSCCVTNTDSVNRRITTYLEKNHLFTSCMYLILSLPDCSSAKNLVDNNAMGNVIELLGTMCELMLICKPAAVPQKIWKEMRQSEANVLSRLTSAWEWYLACLKIMVS